jgi:hypothetical protein
MYSLSRWRTYSVVTGVYVRPLTLEYVQVGTAPDFASSSGGGRPDIPLTFGYYVSGLKPEVAELMAKQAFLNNFFLGVKVSLENVTLFT